MMRWTLCTLAALAASPAAQAIVVPSGSVLVYDTVSGPVIADSIHVQVGAVVRVVGPDPFLVLASGTVRIDGLVDVSGANAGDIATLNSGNLPEPGAAGSAGGGRGGVGSSSVSTSTPAGGRGFGAYDLAAGGAFGGESCFASAALGVDARRPAGGGGGRLAADQPIDPAQPDALVNRGLIARAGEAGSPSGSGAQSGLSPAAGGAPNAGAFTDGDPGNDFFGRRFAGGPVVFGELALPVPGVGGGAGGDALPSSVFPTPNWTPASDEKGAGGGGGGGLAGIFANRIVVGPSGQIRVDGGSGAVGENTLFLNHVGGSSGGGSGGYLLLHAPIVDLRQASADAFTALGGSGGEGFLAGVGAGGSGGPGVIQVHTAGGGHGLLLGARPLVDVTSPNAHSLLPLF